MHSTLKTYFNKYRLDAILISNLTNVHYLTGFTGTNGLALVTKRKAFFLTDFRYKEQAASEVVNFTLVETARDVHGSLLGLLQKQKCKRLGFEAGAMSFAEHSRLQTKLTGTQLVPVTEDPGKLREIKSVAEIAKISRALAFNHRAFAALRPHIKPGISEQALAVELEIALRRAGAEKLAFDTIVASGTRGALPHGRASTKKIKRGELVTIDFGGTFAGYHADETVTIAVGAASIKQKEIYDIVHEAQARAIALARPGVRCSELDQAARDYITQKSYGEFFGHALGHGVGLEVHERPVLSANSSDILQPGMVFTIEPGIYIPGFGGVRIEDVFVCTTTGIRRLSKIDKGRKSWKG